MITDPETLKSLMTEGSLLPQEEMLAIGKRKGKCNSRMSILENNKG